MGRRKKEESESTTGSLSIFSDQQLKEIRKKYGEILVSGQDLFKPEEQRGIIPTTPKLDLALNGGLKEGQIVIISGLEKTGKSTLCLQIISNAIDAGRKHAIFDIEARLDTELLSTIKSLKDRTDKVNVIRAENKEIPAEEWLTMVEHIAKNPENKGAVVVIDSTSVMACRRELEDDLTGEVRVGLPKLLSQFCKRIKTAIRRNRITLILVNHLITNTAPGSHKKYVPDCGLKIRFQASTILQVGHTKKWKEGSGSNEKEVGHEIHWNVLCSALGAAGTSAENKLRYGEGIDIIAEQIDFGCDIGAIDVSGSWYTLSFLEDTPRLQGSAKVRQHFLDHPDHLDQLEQKIKEVSV